MVTVLINRRRLLTGDRFVLPGDARRTLYEVAGRDPKVGLLIRKLKDSWYGYMHEESGVVTGSHQGGEMTELLTIPACVLMRENDLQ